MGNLTSRDNLRNPSRGSRKVILWDGTVEEFEDPITAAELMLDHPLQVVVELQSDSTTGKFKPRPLPADQNLDPNKLYLMLPKHKRGPKATHLSAVDAQRLLLIANSSLSGPHTTTSVMSSSRFLPLFLKVCAGPGLAAAAVRNSHFSGNETSDDVASSGGGGKTDAVRRVPKFDLPEEESEGMPEFLTRQLSGKGTWKPSLDTIVEKKKMEKKRVMVSHWLF